MNIGEVVAKYNRLKNDVLPYAGEAVQEQTKQEMRLLRNGLWDTLVNTKATIRFNSEQELANTIYVLLDTGKIFGIDWVRKTTSSSDPTKKAGMVDTITVKKVNGYVKGTSNGEKQLKDALAGRVTLWVAKGYLMGEGYGNWRSVYAKDIQAITLGGTTVRVTL